MQLSEKEKIWILGMIGAAFDVDQENDRYERVSKEVQKISDKVQEYNAEILKEGSSYPENVYDIGEGLAYKIVESFKE